MKEAKKRWREEFKESTLTAVIKLLQETIYYSQFSAATISLTVSLLIKYGYYTDCE